MARILLAFQDERENPLLCGLLQRLGHKCVGVHTGEEALDTLQTQHPDVVIVHFMLPDRDGFEVLRRIRARPDTARLPIILFSAIADSAFGQYVVSRGANDYWVHGAMDLMRLNEMITKAGVIGR